MKWPLLALPAATVFCLAGLVAGQTASNVTIDDQDARITYEPARASWTLTDPGEWDAGEGRAHMLSDDTSAVATFTFTGVAFYYWAAMWPYPVLNTVTLDGSASLVNLTDPNPPADAGLPPSRKSSVVFSATGLTNTTHTVRVSIGPGGNYAIVDQFTYTSLQTTPLTTTTSPTPPGTTTQTGKGATTGVSNDAYGGSSKAKGLSTAGKVGIAVAIVGLLLLLLVLFFVLRWMKTRKEEDNEKSMVAGYTSPDPDMSLSGSTMRLAHSPVPVEPNPIWTDPDYLEATRRMNFPIPHPYQQQYNGSQSSVRLVPPVERAPVFGSDTSRYSDGSNYPLISHAPPSLSPVPGATPVHIPYHPYAQTRPNYGYSG